ncbi:GerMN domain-containing protein [Tindallia californiensis]|uniref:Sporulation and spore germination n=1 Tax=Tindallia californiensis TaxID=159292 RepID=A0A1H3JNL8_9FIRM|nr:GerMN domain-containing protein [Tindallia californiensis]SDY40978.1 Sporulation and spore germination [Tindallia californiensis]
MKYYKNHARIMMLMVMVAVVMMACGSGDETSEDIVDTEKNEQTVEAFFPFLADTRLIYEGEGSEYADAVVYYDYIDNNQAQRRRQTAGTTIGEIIHREEGVVTLRYSEEEFYSFFSLFEEEPNREEILLKEPLEVGNEWVLEDGRKRSINDVSVPIKTKHGDFDAIEVVTESDEAVQIHYYAQDIGLVKSVFKANGDETGIVTQLAAIEENIPWEVNVRIYYPEWEDEGSLYQSYLMEVRTNESVEKKLTDYLQKEPPVETAAATLQESMMINSLERNKDEQQVKVDFNAAITEVGMGSDFESQMLQSITNTLAYYFNVESVVISVEDGPYETGHFYLGPEDFLVPDNENAEKI